MIKCGMCGTETLDVSTMITHMAKDHKLDFSDGEDMKRRLNAVGIDLYEKVEVKQLRTLHG